MKETYERLVNYGIKPSVQRLAIMEYIITHRTHPSIEEVHKALSTAIPTLSKTTVYNTLKLFAEHGAVSVLTIDEHNVNFDGDTSAHAHFFCKRCGHIYDIEDCPDTIREIGITKKEGHSVLETHYYYKGICKKCLEEME